MPQQRIYDLLKQGFWNTDTKRHETYNNLTMCLLPKGVAVVWLSGANQVLLGRYQGQEIDFDFRRFNSAANRPLMIQQEQAKLPPAVQEEIRSNTLSTRQWDEYLKTYTWQLAFSQPVKLTNHAIGFLNGEDTNYALTPDRTAYVQLASSLARARVPLAAPALPALSWSDRLGFESRADAARIISSRTRSWLCPTRPNTSPITPLCNR